MCVKLDFLENPRPPPAAAGGIKPSTGADDQSGRGTRAVPGGLQEQQLIQSKRRKKKNEMSR